MDGMEFKLERSENYNFNTYTITQTMNQGDDNGNESKSNNLQHGHVDVPTLSRQNSIQLFEKQIQFERLNSAIKESLSLFGITSSSNAQINNAYVFIWVPTLIGILPAIIVGYICNYFFEPEYYLECGTGNTYRNNLSAVNYGDIWCVVVSSATDIFDYTFLGNLAANIIAAWAFVKIVGTFIVNFSGDFELAHSIQQKQMRQMLHHMASLVNHKKDIKCPQCNHQIAMEFIAAHTFTDKYSLVIQICFLFIQ